jgi:putative PIN family toxin of toxin-antitoxin system
VLRVVLDTNVLVSALMKPGSVPDLLLTRFVRHSTFELVLSTAILEELRRVVGYPAVRKRIHASDEELELWLQMLDLLSTPVEVTTRLPGILRDADDEPILATAVDGRADFIVTGDDDLLALGGHDRIRIVTPRAFLDRLNRTSGQPGSVHESVGNTAWTLSGRARRGRRGLEVAGGAGVGLTEAEAEKVADEAVHAVRRRRTR